MFVETVDGKLYVRISALMHPMVAAIDGLTITMFKGDREHYTDARAAIAWCKKESAHARGAELERLLAAVTAISEASDSTTRATMIGDGLLRLLSLDPAAHARKSVL